MRHKGSGYYRSKVELRERLYPRPLFPEERLQNPVINMLEIFAVRRCN
jgi:hypothetical protein